MCGCVARVRARQTPRRAPSPETPKEDVTAVRTTAIAAASALAAATLAVAPAAHAAPSAGPVTVGSTTSSNPLDTLGRPNDETIARVEAFASQPFVPADAANLLRTALAFYAGQGELGGPELPQDAPAFTQFAWPTVSSNCIGPGMHSTASALVVPGPATSPQPGAAAGEATFVFTALGTPAAAQDQGLMNAYWINLDNFRTGVTPLGNHGINPTGPTTLSGTAATGAGRVLAVIDGSARTADNVCKFAPTAASFYVR
ncbi:hypothetical protein ACKFRZ_07985 [Corynebacterium gottingense]|uniref:Rv1157c family protein n=1 Tax=Corynebacterium gottingense TaxID=2041036 RepID=UPI0038CF79BC